MKNFSRTLGQITIFESEGVKSAIRDEENLKYITITLPKVKIYLIIMKKASQVTINKEASLGKKATTLKIIILVLRDIKDSKDLRCK
jgi:hypothetical protein